LACSGGFRTGVCPEDDVNLLAGKHRLAGEIMEVHKGIAIYQIFACPYGFARIRA
jgi:hypothetical protein